MYKVIESKNYRGETIYQLLCDGEYINTHISAKNIEKFKSKGIDFKDSDAIALYISIYNLQNRAKKKIKKITVMIHSILTDEQIINLYLDYRNNFLTPEGFGLHYGLDYDEYMIILDKGRELLG